ncbi:MAG: HNH endonuclease [Mycobacterium sp.]|nr:HNH endonuclease [Mycobacterium sp.]
MKRGIPTKVRAQLHERAHGCCEICGVWGANNAHHRRNQSQGGGHTLSNLMLLCGSGTTGCHGWVTEHPHESITQGWTVPSYVRDALADLSVQRFDRALARRVPVLLDDAGGIEAA